MFKVSCTFNTVFVKMVKILYSTVFVCVDQMSLKKYIKECTTNQPVNHDLPYSIITVNFEAATVFLMKLFFIYIYI